MATIKERLEQEKRDFADALSGKFEVNGRKTVLSKEQAQLIRDAIPSIDYMLLIFKGDVVLPKESENVQSQGGKVFDYMRGSIINIIMAEAILYGKWKNIREYFEVDDNCDDGYTSLADEVNASRVDEDDSDIEDKYEYSLADEVNDQDDVDDDDDYCTWHPKNRGRDDIDCDEGICDCCDC